MECGPVFHQLVGNLSASSAFPVEAGLSASHSIQISVPDGCVGHPAVATMAEAEAGAATKIPVLSHGFDLPVSYPATVSSQSQRLPVALFDDVTNLHTNDFLNVLASKGLKAGPSNEEAKVKSEESLDPSIITSEELLGSSPKAHDSAGVDCPDVADMDDMLDVLSYSYEDLTAPIEDVSLHGDTSWDSYNQACSGFSELTAVQLCIPDDNLAELDWTSDYVHGDALRPAGYSKAKYQHQQHQHRRSYEYERETAGTGAYGGGGMGSPVSMSDQSFGHLHSTAGFEGEAAHPIRARSKRSRGMSRAWSSSNLLSNLDTENEGRPKKRVYKKAYHSSARVPVPSPSSSPSVSEDGNGIVPDLYYMDRSDCSGGENDSRPTYSARKTAGYGTDSSTARRCSHCETTKTPQWRAGPNGPKTLCNACGVRYKSGRLLPEYRPAGSPGYIGHKHSNSHRKIIEMRRLREEARATAPDRHPLHAPAAAAPPVAV